MRWKRFSIVILLMIVLAAIWNYRVDASSDKVTYSMNQKTGTLTIKGKGNMPSSMTFQNQKEIKRVIIEEGVQSIPKKAFYQCENLKQVSIPNSVRKIGNLSFSETGITKITIPNCEKVGERAFERCKKLKVAYISPNCKEIGAICFNGCKKLQQVTIPGEYKTDDKIVMYGCVAVMYMDIFGRCDNLDTIRLNSNLDEYMLDFFNSYNIECYKEDPYYKSIDGVVYSKDESTLVGCPKKRTILVVREGTRVLADTFIEREYDDPVMEDRIGSSVRVIVLPDTIESAMDQSYDEKYDIYINHYTDDIRDKLDLQQRIRKTFPRSTIYIEPVHVTDKYVYTASKKLLQYTGNKKKVVIPEGIQVLGKYSFYNVTHVNRVVLPKGLKEIEQYAFAECVNLSSVKLPNSLQKIREWAFFNSGIKKITIPKNVKKIEDFAFDSCKNLKLVDVYADPTVIYKAYNDIFKADICYKTSPTKFRPICHVGWITSDNGEVLISISANKIRGISGYQVQLSRGYSFKEKENFVIKGNKKRFWITTDNSKINYVRVRTYKKQNGKTVYGKWKVKKIYL